MRSILFIAFTALLIGSAHAQDTSRNTLVGFPITDYIITSDSIQIVQVELIDGLVIPDKQIGLLKGIYFNGKVDTTQVGWGRCNLIKGNFYYFGLHIYDQKRLAKKGDLLYTRINKTNAYQSPLLSVMSKSITLKNVYDVDLCDPMSALVNWTKAKDAALIDSLVADIRLTGKEMKVQMPDNNLKIPSGKYKDKLLFDMMQQTKKEDLSAFIDYINARPGNYAGNTWKISEIYATWLNAGAPMVVK